MNVTELINYKKEYNIFRKENINLRNEILEKDIKIDKLKKKIIKLDKNRYNCCDCFN